MLHHKVVCSAMERLKIKRMIEPNTNIFNSASQLFQLSGLGKKEHPISRISKMDFPTFVLV